MRKSAYKRQKEQENERKLEEFKKRLQDKLDETIKVEKKKEEERQKAYDNETDEEKKMQLEKNGLLILSRIFPSKNKNY